MKRYLIVGLIALACSGCQDVWRESAKESMVLSEKTKQTVVDDLYKIQLQQSALNAINKLKVAETPEEIQTAVEQLLQIQSDVTWLLRQFERCGSLDTMGMIYVQSQKSWLELTKERLTKAYKEAKDKQATTQPAK